MLFDHHIQYEVPWSHGVLCQRSVRDGVTSWWRPCLTIPDVPGLYEHFVAEQLRYGMPAGNVLTPEGYAVFAFHMASHVIAYTPHGGEVRRVLAGVELQLPGNNHWDKYSGLLEAKQAWDRRINGALHAGR